VEPALLSVICDELNRRRLERGQVQITANLLIGERESIIRSFYERAFDGVKPQVRDWVEDKLLTGSGYRHRAALEDALKLGLPEAAFSQLEDSRLLHREERDGVVWLELTHDLLTDPAVHSREARHQRRAIEEARLREHEARRQLEEIEGREREARRLLRRSRITTAVFAILLVLALSAMVLASLARREAKALRLQATQSEAYLNQQAVVAIRHLDPRGGFYPAPGLDPVSARQGWVDVIDSLDAAGGFHSLYHQFAEAETALRTSVEFRGNPPARIHLRVYPRHVADGLEKLADVLIQEEKYQQAEDCLLKAQALLDGDPGKASAALVEIYARLVSLYEAWRKPARAAVWKGKLAGFGPIRLAGGTIPELPANLIGFWKLEGDASDSAGTNHGTCFGGVTTTTGKVGQALRFNGTDGGVQIPNAPTPSSFSISAWARFDRLDSKANWPGLQFLVFRKNSRPNNFEGFALLKVREYDSVDRFALEVTSAEGDNTKIYSPGIMTNVFYHVVGTFDGSWARLYMDGEQCAWAYHPYPIDYGTRPMFFGTSGEDWDGRFAGTLDEVSLYDWALSPAQVQALFEAKGRKEQRK